MKRGVLVTFIAILIPWILSAQPSTPKEPAKFVLEQAVILPVEHNKDMQVSK